jgi:hypothetical protein
MYTNNTKDPVIAMIAVLDKNNAPILLNNFLADARYPSGEEDPNHVKLNN